MPYQKTVFYTFLHFVQVKFAPKRRQPEDLFFPIHQSRMCAFKILKQRHNSSSEISLDNVFIQRQQWNIIFKTSNANQIALLGCRVNQRLTLGIVKLCPIAIFPLCRALTLQYIGCIGVTFYTTDPWYCEAVVPSYILKDGFRGCKTPQTI